MSFEKLKKSNSTILIPVFIPAVIVISLMVIGTISNPKLAGDIFADVLAYITEDFGWFYMLCVALFLIFVVGVAISPWGKIKLGPDLIQSLNIVLALGLLCFFLLVME